MARSSLKRVLRAGLGPYQYWVVYAIDLPQPAVELPEGLTVRPVHAAELQAVSDPELCKRVYEDHEQVAGFGLYEQGELTTVQWYLWGQRYWEEREGRSWPLATDEVKSMSLYTRPTYRGRGLATLLKRETAHRMSERGFRRIYCRIWHSHHGSIAVSRKAGWYKVGSYIEIAPFGRRLQFCTRL